MALIFSVSCARFEQMPVSVLCLPDFTVLLAHFLHYHVLTLAEMLALPVS